MSLKVLAIGEAMLELSHRSETELMLSVAGDTFNTAAHLARRLGANALVSYFTAIGEGWYADFVRRRIEDEGVVPAVVTAAGTPGAYFIRTDTSGERSFTYFRSGSPASRMLEGDGIALLTAASENVELVHLSAITLQILAPGDRAILASTLQRARESGTRVSLDTNYRPSGWPPDTDARAAVDDFAAYADIVLPNLDDERALRGAVDAQDVVKHYRALGADEIVVTDSTSPTMVAWPEAATRVPVEQPTRVVDTTGAGDAFDAGYLAGRLLQADPVTAVRLGHEAAAEVVAHAGALPPRPSPALPTQP